MKVGQSLDDIINQHIERLSTTRENPIGTMGTVLDGTSQPFYNSSPQVQGVLQWGFSTWGVEPVIGIDKPQNRK